MSSGGDGLNDRGCEYGMYGGQHCAVALRVQQRGVPPQRDPGPVALVSLEVLLSKSWSWRRSRRIMRPHEHHSKTVVCNGYFKKIVLLAGRARPRGRVALIGPLH
jgi:hypothetical protein